MPYLALDHHYAMTWMQKKSIQNEPQNLILLVNTWPTEGVIISGLWGKICLLSRFNFYRPNIDIDGNISIYALEGNRQWKIFPSSLPRCCLLAPLSEPLLCAVNTRHISIIYDPRHNNHPQWCNLILIPANLYGLIPTATTAPTQDLAYPFSSADCYSKRPIISINHRTNESADRIVADTTGA